MKTPVPAANRLIELLSRPRRHQFVANCESVDLVYGVVLCEADQPVDHVYFPLTGFISLVTTLQGHRPLEMGLIGNEGMLGTTLALGVDSTPMRAVVQGSGTALRMTAAKMRYQLRSNPLMRDAMNRYLYVVMAVLTQSAACTHFHAIEPRLARWLLMTHDRAHLDRFYLTHDLLADMLGVRRSGVTIAAGALQRKKLIRYTRGIIDILDRRGLESVSCECYALMRERDRQQFS